jgi:hypothetical protein
LHSQLAHVRAADRHTGQLGLREDQVQRVAIALDLGDVPEIHDVTAVAAKEHGRIEPIKRDRLRKPRLRRSGRSNSRAQHTDNGRPDPLLLLQRLPRRV